jgi:hypothetical protein
MHELAKRAIDGTIGFFYSLLHLYLGNLILIPQQWIIREGFEVSICCEAKYQYVCT